VKSASRRVVAAYVVLALLASGALIGRRGLRTYAASRVTPPG